MWARLSAYIKQLTESPNILHRPEIISTTFGVRGIGHLFEFFIFKSVKNKGVCDVNTPYTTFYHSKNDPGTAEIQDVVT
jgi:hypothetical protein